MKAFYEIADGARAPHTRSSYYSVIHAKTFPAHFHRAIEFVYVLSGEMVYVCEGKEYTVREGSVLLSLPYQAHEYRVEKPTDLFYFIADPHMIPSLALTLENRIPASPVRAYGEEGQAFFGSLIGVLRDDDRIPKSWQIPSHPYIVPILSAMLEYHFEHVGLEASRGETSQLSLLQRIMLHLEEHYPEDGYSVSGAAQALGISPQYLSTIVRERTGRSLTEHLHNIRITHAQNLLLKSDATVTEIALASGFSSIRTFNRVFREYTGVSPGEWRKNQQK